MWSSLCSNILAVLTVLLVYFWFKVKFEFWKRRNIATLPTWDILKISVRTLLHQISMTDRWLLNYKYLKSKGFKHGGGFLLWCPFYIPMDLDLVKSIMQVDFQHFTDRGRYSNANNCPLSLNLFDLGGIRWRILRRKLTPTFSSGKMKMMFETLVDCTPALHRVMDNHLGEAVDIKDVLGRFTTDIIGSCAFGIDCNTLDNPESEFREKGIAYFKGGFVDHLVNLMNSNMPKIMKLLNAKSIRDDISEFFIGVVQKTVKYREENNIYRKDFMHLLIQLKNKGKLLEDTEISNEFLTSEDNMITLDEIAAQAFIFFEAGFETSSTTMTFCLYELSKNKDIQEKLRDEMKHTMKKHGDQLSYEAVMEMNYLEQVIIETLRKYPPLPVLPRVCTKRYKVPGSDLVLEKGTRVIIPVVGIQRDPEFFPDPDKFDPDRFSETNKKLHKSFSFLSFGEGPRICIGKRFGMLQTKVGLIALLMKYKVSVNEKTIEPLEYDPKSPIMSTKGEVWLDFTKISDETIKS